MRGSGERGTTLLSSPFYKRTCDDSQSFVQVTRLDMELWSAYNCQELNFSGATHVQLVLFRAERSVSVKAVKIQRLLMAAVKMCVIINALLAFV